MMAASQYQLEDDDALYGSSASENPYSDFQSNGNDSFLQMKRSNKHHALAGAAQCLSLSPQSRNE